MKKRIAVAVCTAMMMLCVMAPALAAEVYPIEVKEYMMGDSPHITKVYQLSLSDSPAAIPTEDFERDGYLYHLLDMTQAHDVGVDTKTYSETITQDSDTGELSEVLKQLTGQREVTTEDGYTGVLYLDHTSVSAQAKGYKTSTRNLSASRTYPGLSDADLSLVPKTVNQGGKTLTLSNVQWSTDYDEDGSAFYTASATYSGTSTSRYATGYTVTATYTGNVAKTKCEIATYTAIFTGTKIEPEQPEVVSVPIEEEPDPVEDEPEPVRAGVDWLSVTGCVGGIAGLSAAVLTVLPKFKERKITP